MKTRIGIIAALVVAVFGSAWLGAHPADAHGPEMTVYKSATCGCCAKWIDHMRKHGFQVTVVDVSDVTAVKEQHGVPRALYSCHTAIVDGYVIEGHVPADVVLSFLEERPDDAGLAVPGMPMGSPGMEGDYKEPYDVIAFDRNGGGRIYASR